MPTTTPRRTFAAVLVVCSIGCAPSSGPTLPSSTTIPPATPTPSPLVEFPPLSGPSRTFVFDHQESYVVRSFTRTSQFVFYENGAFVLKYQPTASFDGALRGQYHEARGTLHLLFQFQGRRANEEWTDATGTLEGDTVTIRFNPTMQQNDYENGVYVLRR